MQFTVLIEFLVPGLATTLLTLAVLPCNALPNLPASLGDGDAGDTVTALLLLAIAYPVGILVNFLVFQILQAHWLVPRNRRRLLAQYREALGPSFRGMPRKGTGAFSGEFLREVFGRLQAAAFEKSIDRLSSHTQFHQSLQRLARGMVVPLLLASYWVCRNQNPAWGILLGALVLLLVLSLWLLCYSIRAEEQKLVLFYIELRSS